MSGTQSSCQGVPDGPRTRLRNRVQITTDGHQPYIEAVERAFGADVDYAMLIKDYGEDDNEAQPTARATQPTRCTGREVRVDRATPQQISTSYVERQNLTMRMGMRRFTRLTNGFSKKVENHAARGRPALHVHQLRTAPQEPCEPVSPDPRDGRGLADHIWTCEEIAALLDV